MKHPRLLLFLLVTLLIPHLAMGSGEGVQVDADLPGVAIFLDNVYIGDTPLKIPELEIGQHQIGATVSGHIPQVQNITVPYEESDQIFFTFGVESGNRHPGIIKIRDCVGTPEQTGILGSSVTIVTLPNDNLMAYYSGLGEGVQCAGSTNGSHWYEYPEGCLELSDNDDTQMQLSRPWVYKAKDSGYWMIYLSGDEMGSSLFHAFSLDGIRFSPAGRITIHHLPGSDSDIPEQYSKPTGIRLEDGRLRMYYSIQGGWVKSAVSDDDGLTWIDEEGYRLDSATDPFVVLLPDKNIGLFYVDLSTGAKGKRLMLATSPDGLVFTPSESGPIIESDQKGVWIIDPDIHVSRDGTWILYFSIMGAAGETGLTVPTVMKAVIDPACLLNQISLSKKD